MASLKSEREVDKVTIERLEREIFSLAKVEGPTTSDDEIVLLKKTLHDVTMQNQKLRDDIKSTMESVKPNGSVLTPYMMERAKEVLGEELQAMPAAAEVQFMCLMKDHDRATLELTLVTKTLARWSKERHTTKLDNQVQRKLCSGAPTPDEADTAPVHGDQLNQMCDVKNNDTPIDQNNALSFCEKEVKHFRHCAFLVQQKNEQLLIDPEKENVNKCTRQTAEPLDIKPNPTIENEDAKLESPCLLSESRENDGILALLSSSSRRADSDNQKCINNSAATDSYNEEIIQLKSALKQGLDVMSTYSAHLIELHRVVSDTKKNRVEHAQVRCLTNIIQEKNRIIRALRREQLTLRVNGLVEKEPKADRSISTLGTIDISIPCAEHSRKVSPDLEKSLADASKLIDLKSSEVNLRDQHILELKQKLTSSEEAQSGLACRLEEVTNEAQLLKADISTLTQALQRESSDSRASQQIILDLKQQIEEANAEVQSLKEANADVQSKSKKFSFILKEKDQNLQLVEEEMHKMKSNLSAVRLARSRVEQNLKVSQENACAAMEDISKMKTQIRELKNKVIEAQNEKIRLSKRARVAANKLKEATDCSQATDPVELEKRIQVLNKTVSGLSALNSKLRIEVASIKLAFDKENSIHNKNRKMSSKALASPSTRCNVCSSLEAQIKSLEQSLTAEKKNRSENISTIRIYEKKINTLENELDSAIEKSGQEESKESACTYTVSSRRTVILNHELA